MADRKKVFGIVPPTGKYIREDRCQTPIKNLKTVSLRPPIDLLYALGAFEAAHEVGARRIAICCDPGSPLAEEAEIVIAPQVGPEVVAGSTRMKGGLVQKMILHMLSTTVMVRLGRVEGNFMTRISPVNEKLRSRAVGIVSELAGVTAERARELLEAHDGSVEGALAVARRGPR